MAKSSGLEGFDELLDDLNRLGNVGKKIGKKAVQNASKIVLNQQKKDAPRDGDNDHGADKLKITNIKTYKSGTVVGRVGIDSSNWDDVEHLYYQHYGFEHYKNGQRVDVNVGWMDDSFKKVKDQAYESIEKEVLSEIDKIIK